MDLVYNSTRGQDRASASEAILKGLAQDGGLFVPEEIPKLDISLKELGELSYQETAYRIMRLFLTDFTDEELRHCIESAYDRKFDTPEIAPISDADGTYYLELYHGATIAFKDMALSILPHLMTTAAKKCHTDKEIVILTATSGDTGKAAMAGFADVEGTRIIVFYPKDGVSPVQERQMVTQKGENTFVVGIHGNFDDAQTGVKKMFSDKKLAADLAAAGYQFSSANSINIGRLVPQIVYYVYAYTRLLHYGRIQEGDPVNIVVPTGNFGNILAASYAKAMGLPVHQLICASNENKVLYDFFSTGTYDRNRAFYVTSSPSMDILISSNLERLIYQIADADPVRTAALMEALSKTGHYSITPDMAEKLSGFTGGYATQKETSDMIRKLFKETGYVIDTHTAVAAAVYQKYKDETGDQTPAIIASTASPFKFAGSVMRAIDPSCDQDGSDDFALIRKLADTAGLEIPPAVSEIMDAPVRHQTQCDAGEMEAAVRNWLGIEG